MGLTDRNRMKRLDQAQEIVPETKLVSYSQGVTGPDPRLAFLAIGGGAVVVMVVLLVLKAVLVIPALAVLAVVKAMVNPGRAVVVGDFGLTVLERSMWTGRPTKLVTRLAHTQAPDVERRESRTLMLLPGSTVWLDNKEFAFVQRGVQALQTLKTPLPAAPKATPIDEPVESPATETEAIEDFDFETEDMDTAAIDFETEVTDLETEVVETDATDSETEIDTVDEIDSIEDTESDSDDDVASAESQDVEDEQMPAVTGDPDGGLEELTATELAG